MSKRPKYYCTFALDRDIIKRLYLNLYFDGYIPSNTLYRDPIILEYILHYNGGIENAKLEVLYCYGDCVRHCYFDNKRLYAIVYKFWYYDKADKKNKFISVRFTKHGSKEAYKNYMAKYIQ